MSALYVFLRHFAALVYPVRCPVCNEIISATDTFCDKCMSELVIYQDNFSIPKVKKFIAVFEYNQKISPAVFIMKNSICGNSPYAFGKFLSQRIKSENITADFIIPVPMYKTNLKQRGYNQAELIAKYIGRFLGIKVCCDVVIKNRKTPAQKNLTRLQRKTNLKDAFSITDISKVKNKRIIIVDDICTTGSTLSEITNLLIKSGVAEVYCVCACKTPNKPYKQGEKNESR